MDGFQLFKMLNKGYWSSFSRSPMFSRFSISFFIPLIQVCASSADSATKSRLPLRPRKTNVKQRLAGNSSAMLSSTSDWWPSRTASTSLTETGHQERHSNTRPMSNTWKQWKVQRIYSIKRQVILWSTGVNHKHRNKQKSITLLWGRLQNHVPMKRKMVRMQKR